MLKKQMIRLAIVISVLAVPTAWGWAADSGFGIQVAAFRTEKRAKSEIARWQKKGQSVFYHHEAVKNKGRWYRIYIGPFDDLAKAKTQARKLKKQGMLSSYFIRSLKTAPAEMKPVEMKNDANSIDPSFMSYGPPKPAQQVPPRKVRLFTKAKKRKLPEPAVATEEKQETKTVPKPVKVTDIRFKKGLKDTEQVVIRFEGALLPMVRFYGKDLDPKLVVSIEGGYTDAEHLFPLPIGGQWIKKIEPHYENEAKRLDISVALTSSLHVAVMQKLAHDQKTFTLIFQSAYAKDVQ